MNENELDELQIEKKKYGMLKVRVTTVSVHSQRSADDSDDITVQDDFWEHSLMSEKAQCW